MLTMLRRNLTSLRKHHGQGSDVSLETKIKESNINLTSREKTTQAKFKQFMNFIFYKWGNYYFISKVIVVSNIGKDAWDSVSTITRVKPLRSSTLKLYSMLCRRRVASACMQRNVWKSPPRAYDWNVLWCLLCQKAIDICVFLFCGLAVENSNCRQQFVTQFKKCLVTLDSIL